MTDEWAMHALGADWAVTIGALSGSIGVQIGRMGSSGFGLVSPCVFGILC